MKKHLQKILAVVKNLTPKVNPGEFLFPSRVGLRKIQWSFTAPRFTSKTLHSCLEHNMKMKYLKYHKVNLVGLYQYLRPSPYIQTHPHLSKSKSIYIYLLPIHPLHSKNTDLIVIVQYTSIHYTRILVTIDYNRDNNC